MFAEVSPVKILIGVLMTTAVLPAPAVGSQWGCEVLLCASSSNPSWRGVPACHPPMSRLISAMKKPGFDWPTCPEGGMGVPGYQRYAECPDGYEVGDTRDRNGVARTADLCFKTVNICQGNTHGPYNSDRQRSCMQTVSISRPLRSEPYFFDVMNDTSGKTERHWFELHK